MGYKHCLFLNVVYQTNLGALKILKYKNRTSLKVVKCQIWKGFCFCFSCFQRTGFCTNCAVGSKTCTLLSLGNNSQCEDPVSITMDKNIKWKEDRSILPHISPFCPREDVAQSYEAGGRTGEGSLALESPPVCTWPLTDDGLDQSQTAPNCPSRPLHSLHFCLTLLFGMGLGGLTRLPLLLWKH